MMMVMARMRLRRRRKGKREEWETDDGVFVSLWFWFDFPWVGLGLVPRLWIRLAHKQDLLRREAERVACAFCLHWREIARVGYLGCIVIYSPIIYHALSRVRSGNPGYGIITAQPLILSLSSLLCADFLFLPCEASQLNMLAYGLRRWWFSVLMISRYLTLVPPLL